MYGCEREDDPQKVCCELMNKEHESFSVAKCSLFLNVSQLLLGLAQTGWYIACGVGKEH